MPFPPYALDSELVAELLSFVKANDFVQLYKAYSWQKDTYDSGFPDICKLESRLATNDVNKGVTLNDVKAVAEWGRLRNQARIAGNPIVAPPFTFRTPGGASQPTLEDSPLTPLYVIRDRLAGGIGPTYLSKVLRFSLPQEYGAIDTRCVRVFGCGDPKAHRHGWLKLRARNDGDSWCIPERQPRWPEGYACWVNILRFFASVLPADCPHPETLTMNALRTPGAWLCADVEMALFAYASRYAL